MNEEVENAEQHFDALDGVSVATKLSTVPPVKEFDKKKDSMATKPFPTELKAFFKIYIESNSPLFHEFTHEM